jgi:hypothetical protein
MPHSLRSPFSPAMLVVFGPVDHIRGEKLPSCRPAKHDRACWEKSQTSSGYLLPLLTIPFSPLNNTLFFPLGFSCRLISS